MDKSLKTPNLIRAVIVDNEPDSIAIMGHHLSMVAPQVSIVGTAESSEAAFKLLDEVHPDLIFIDTNISNQNGVEFIKKVKPSGVETIFISTHADYAVQAFKMNAVDYLLKPLDYKELSASIEKAEERIMRKEVKKSKSAIEGIVQNMSNPYNPFSKICIPGKESILFLDLSDILYCESDINYSKIHTVNNNVFISAKSLKMYDQVLSRMNFFRIHKSYLVNLNHMKKYVRGESGYVIMNNDQQLPVARRQREGFIKKINI